MEHLAERLRHTGGRKQYGYLKAPLKAVVDEIVDELTKEPCVAAAYALWYDCLLYTSWGCPITMCIWFTRQRMSALSLPQISPP